MDPKQILIQLVIAAICAAIANALVPRTIPGKIIGLILIGLAGVWFGAWAHALVRNQYGIDFDFLNWQFEGVTIIPSIIGSAIILYVVTALLRWGRYT